MASPSAPSVVELRDVSKRFVIRKDKSIKERVVNAGRSKAHKSDFWALRDVSLDVLAGQTLGLVGPNGSGKSTLLKTIGGIIQPDSGTVRLRGRLAALLELGAGFHPDLTGRENVFLNASILGLSRPEVVRSFDRILEFSGIGAFIDTQVKFYSSGMYVRLAFAVAVHSDPDILLVDEVLAVGDEPFQRKCMERIRQFQAEGRTIVLVSHSASQVAEVCDRAVVLEHGHLVADGTPQDALHRLRHDYEQRIQDDIAQKAAQPESGAPAQRRGKISEVRVAAPTGPTTEASLTSLDDLVVTGRVDVTEPLDRWTLALGVETTLGQLVFATDTNLLGSELPPLRSSSTFTFRMPRMALAEGDYAINVAVRDGMGQDVDRAARAASLTVTGTGRTVGYVFNEPELEVLSG